MSVTVREITVAEVRALINGSSEDVVGQLLFENAPMRYLLAMSDLAEDQAEALRPSELNTVVEACRELNPYFFQLTARLDALLKAAAAN